jgi:hypothetical protein
MKYQNQIAIPKQKREKEVREYRLAFERKGIG